MERNKTEQNMTYETPLDPLSDAEFDDALSKTLSAAVSSRQKASFSSTEDFADWLRQGEQKRKQRRCRRIVYILAAAAAVFAFAIYLCTSCFETVLPASILLPWDSTPTYADSDTENNITEENGSIVIGGDGNENMGEWHATFTSYDDIPEKYQKEIIWFEDLPEGYELNSIKINRELEGIYYETTYHIDDNVVIRFKQANFEPINKVSIINQFDETIKLANRTVYFKKIDPINLYVFFENDHIIYIYDILKLNKKNIEVIITSIKTGWSMP